MQAIAGRSRQPAFIDSLRRNGGYLLLCGAALTLAVISLSPLLANGLNGDDLPNSVTFAASALHAQGQGLGDIVHSILASVPGWAESGRFFPLSAFSDFVLYFVDGNALALKLFVLTLILVDLCLLGYLTTQITASRTAGVLAILITPLLFQFRTGVYHDPITAFGGLLQVVLTSTLISLVLLLLYLRSSRRRYLVASVAIYAANLLTYEITIPFFLLFAVLAWLYPVRRSLLMSARISWPFAAVAGAAVALNMGLRLFYQVAFSGSAADYAQAAAAGGPIARAYIPNLAPGAILATIAHQVSAALPLGFQQLAAPGRWTFPSFSADLGAQPMFYLLLIAGYGAMAVVLGLELWYEVLARAHGFRPGLLGLLGLGLLILPNAMISLSPRYQAETSWGIGYLPVYLSYFGVALLLADLTYGLFRLAGSAERHAALSTVTTVALGLGIAWVAVVNNTNLGVDFLLLALTYGLFRVTASAERAVAVALSTVTTFALSIGIPYVSVVNHANNSIAVETGNVSVWYPRVTVAAAVQRGLFTGVPADATIVIDGSEPAWDVAGVPPFFTGQAGVTVASMVNVAKAIETMRATTPSFTSADGASTYLVSPQSDIYYLAYKSAWRGNGYAMLGRIREVTVAANGVPSIELEPAHVFMSTAPLEASTPNLLLGPHGQGLATTSPTELGIDPNEMNRVASGSEWSLFATITGGTLTWVP
jgi:hypothetical protein